MTTSTIGRPTFRQTLSAALAETRMRMINISRYPGQLMLEIIIPIVFAAMPILLGRANGADAAANFKANTGTANYVAFLLIGANAFTLVSNAFWHIAYWLRFEQETGTLESVYLTPTSSVTLASGVALYSIVRGLTAAFLAFFLGCLIFQVNPFEGDVWLALAFILAGLIPLYGVALLFGAVVLKVKESNAIVGLMQWAVGFLMGLFYPVAVLPPLVRWAALLFPPTWMTNGVRSALLGVGFFFGEWYLDMAVLWAFMLFAPLFGFWVFNRVERGIQRNEGVGQF
ncbi:MAG: Transport permease protein [Anaerolineales bacterium]|jgi:ABC-2 type transport system permease protein|nr:Transport permease protein [Anaerolineales bacterium]